HSNGVVLTYGAMTAASGFAGITCGGAAVSTFEEGTDLRSNPDGGTHSLHNRAAIFEEFRGNNDLAHSTVRFIDVASGLRDQFEDNNTLVKAAPVRLPFDTVDPKRFSDLTPGDVDFYRFRVKAGTLLAAEIVRGTVDTILGLFDVQTGQLLALNNNGGAFSTGFSRLLVSIDADREVALAVSAFPDVAFTGSPIR